MNTPEPTRWPADRFAVEERIRSLLEDYHFDAQTVPPLNKLTSVIDEASLARLLTKLAVGSATVWWSLLELKEMVSLYKRSRKNKV